MMNLSGDEEISEDFEGENEEILSEFGDGESNKSKIKFSKEQENISVRVIQHNIDNMSQISQSQNKSKSKNRVNNNNGQRKFELLKMHKGITRF